MRSKTLRIVGGVFCVVLLAGCVTSPKKTVRVEINSDSRIRVYGEDVSYAELLDKLKKMGVTFETRITISAHYRVSDRLLYSMKESLIKAGFPRVIIAKKRKPEARVGEKLQFKK